MESFPHPIERNFREPMNIELQFNSKKTIVVIHFKRIIPLFLPYRKLD